MYYQRYVSKIWIKPHDANGRLLHLVLLQAESRGRTRLMRFTRICCCL